MTDSKREAWRERAEIATAQAAAHTEAEAAFERTRLAMVGVTHGLDRAAAVQLAALAIETAKQADITAEAFVIGTARMHAAESRTTPEQVRRMFLPPTGHHRARSTAKNASQSVMRFARRVLLRRK